MYRYLNFLSDRVTNKHSYDITYAIFPIRSLSSILLNTLKHFQRLSKFAFRKTKREDVNSLQIHFLKIPSLLFLCKVFCLNFKPNIKVYWSKNLNSFRTIDEEDEDWVRSHQEGNFAIAVNLVVGQCLFYSVNVPALSSNPPSITSPVLTVFTFAVWSTKLLIWLDVYVSITSVLKHAVN